MWIKEWKVNIFWDWPRPRATVRSHIKIIVLIWIFCRCTFNPIVIVVNFTKSTKIQDYYKKKKQFKT